jgi:hypothetical protein
MKKQSFVLTSLFESTEQFSKENENVNKGILIKYISGILVRLKS